jgi:hypothetical protein
MPDSGSDAVTRLSNVSGAVADRPEIKVEKGFKMTAPSMAAVFTCVVAGLVVIPEASGQGLEPWVGLTQEGLGTNEAGDRFGGAVAVGDFDGDGIDDLAVGAPGEAPGAAPAGGVVFVFRGTPEGLEPWHVLDQQELGANEDGDQFGSALAAGDFDGDGMDDLAVGAPREAPADEPRSGWVFVFRGAGGGLESWDAFGQAGLGDNEAGDGFGESLAVGDFDGDGWDDLAVGAPGEAVGEARSGAVFVFVGAVNGLAPWHSLDQEQLGMNEDDDLFGMALAAADFDGDGMDDLAVGAPREAPGDLPRSGWVFLFRGTSAGLDAWHAFGQEGLGYDDSGDQFGMELAAGDFDGDGLADLAVGAISEAVNSQTNAGAVYVFQGSAGGLVAWSYLDQAGLGDNEAYDLFGFSLAAGDFDADGLDDLAVGAPGESPGADPRSGAVFLFYGSWGGPQPLGSVTQQGLGDNESDDGFGHSMAAGDFNGAGSSDLAVGAPGESPGAGPKSGAVFVFRGVR